MYYLITYSQKTKGGNAIPANLAINMLPAMWLLEMMQAYPSDNTLLLFAMPITESEFKELDGEI